MCGRIAVNAERCGTRIYQFTEWDVCCLLGWVMLASASQAIKMLPLYKRRKGNNRETKQKLSKETITGSIH
jgi:hypothetical protein